MGICISPHGGEGQKNHSGRDLNQPVKSVFMCVLGGMTFSMTQTIFFFFKISFLVFEDLGLALPRVEG